MDPAMARPPPPTPDDDFTDDLPTEQVVREGTGIMMIDEAPAPIAALARRAEPPTPPPAPAPLGRWDATPIDPSVAEEARGARFRPSATPPPIARAAPAADTRRPQDWPIIVIGLSLGALLAIAFWWLSYG
jgi:hypothetical protein